VTAFDDSAREHVAFSYPATPDGDRLRETVDAVVRCLTDDGAVGFAECSSQIGSSRMSLTMTLAPSLANRSAMARPSPDAAPVTTATFPSKRTRILLILYLYLKARKLIAALHLKQSENFKL